MWYHLSVRGICKLQHPYYPQEREHNPLLFSIHSFNLYRIPTYGGSHAKYWRFKDTYFVTPMMSSLLCINSLYSFFSSSTLGVRYLLVSLSWDMPRWLTLVRKTWVGVMWAEVLGALGDGFLLSSHHSLWEEHAPGISSHWFQGDARYMQQTWIQPAACSQSQLTCKTKKERKQTCFKNWPFRVVSYSALLQQ